MLHLQCRAWTGRVVAAVYVPMSRSGRAVSWNAQLAGKPLRAILQILSQFYDGLDPMSAPPVSLSR